MLEMSKKCPKHIMTLCDRKVEWYNMHTKDKPRMSAAENQIVVYQPNETVRLDVRMKCCQCENVASGQFLFPIKEAA